jgi:hypothetical protein
MTTTANTTEQTSPYNMLNIPDKLTKDEVLKLADFLANNSIQNKLNISLDVDLNFEQDRELLKYLIKHVEEKKGQYNNFTLDIPKTEKNKPSFVKNKTAYINFVKKHVNDPKYKGRFVAFVDGKLQGVDDKERVLAKKVYDKCGYVDMYVGKVTTQKTIINMGCRV